MKIGIIQTRGIGDILIALPIAKYFHDNNNEVFWPIDEKFLPSFQEVAPWVNWIGVPRVAADVLFNPEFMYDIPLNLLSRVGVKKLLRCIAILTLSQIWQISYFSVP